MDINIGILGLGNVGSGLYKILKEDIRCSNHRLVVTKILVRDKNKNRNIDIDEKVLTTNADDILDNDCVDIVVELIGGIHPAYEYIRKALDNGKHVVTANKAVIAKYGDELEKLAKTKQCMLRYEASVGGGIPIISTLSKDLTSNRIKHIAGIINGTTNYVLTKMEFENMSFEDALKTAQKSGYAEADPTSDIEGYDSAYKLSILTSIAYGVNIPPDSIPRAGISGIDIEDIEYAKHLGFKIKLIASAKTFDDILEVYVHPALVPDSHPLSSVNNEYNAVFIEGEAVGELMLYGKGAGANPTGSAVASDIFDIVRGLDESKLFIYPRCRTKSYKIASDFYGAYYIRLQVMDNPGVLGKVSTTFGKYGISLKSVVQKGRENPVALVFVTHEVSKSTLDKALSEIEQMQEVDYVANILKVKRF